MSWHSNSSVHLTGLGIRKCVLAMPRRRHFGVHSLDDASTLPALCSASATAASVAGTVNIPRNS